MAKDGVAIMLALSLQRGMEITVPTKLLGDHGRLIRSGGTSSPRIEFLQCDNIYRHLGNHFGYARFRTPPIHSCTAMHIIRRDAQFRFRCWCSHVGASSKPLHLGPKYGHHPTFNLFLPGSISPILQRNFAGPALVVLEDFCMRRNELRVQHVQVRFFIQ